MTLWKTVAAVVAASLAVVACGNQTSTQTKATPSATSSATSVNQAADLRVGLDYLLGEHLILAAKATGAALGGRSDEFSAYGSLLNRNGNDLGAMIGAAYGQEAQNRFNQIWSAHNGFFVEYTTGVAKKDQAMQTKAVQDLTTQYVPQFAEFLAGATGLPKDTLANVTTQHVLQTKQVVDDQAAGNWPAVYKDIRIAYHHMYEIGDALAPAIASKNPQKFPGNAAQKAVDFRVALDRLLQEHLWLATFATDAALHGRNSEFQAAGQALNDNGNDLGAAIGSLYGQEAQNRFNQIWSAHNGFFVEYTTGVAKKDQAMQTKAVQDLTTQYVPQFAEFLAGATGLPKGTLEDLTKQHVLHTKAVVDAQASDSWQQAAQMDLTAADQMRQIGDPLATAIVAKFPSKF